VGLRRGNLGGREKLEGGGWTLRVDVVDPDVLILDQKLAFLRLRDREVSAVLEDFDSACFLDEDAPHCFGDAGGSHCAG
jgi:hypothetical protein